MAEIILLSNTRLSFPNLIEPRAAAENPNAVKKYSADFIMDQDTPAFKQFMAECGKLALEKWGEHANNVMQLIQQDRRLRCYGSGSERIDKKTFAPYKGYEGKVYIAANRAEPPQMIQSDGTPVDPSNTMGYQMLARKMYGGCYVNAAVRPWLQDNAHGRGIRCDLVAIQFHADGEAFGEGATDASSLFGAVAGGAAAPAAVGGLPLPPFMQG